MFGYIYIVTCLIDGKIYIGQHKSEEFDDSYLGSGVNIKKSVKKYGSESFSVSLLEWCSTQEEANEKEVYYIEAYDSRNPEIGYNIAAGGQERFFTGCEHTECARKKMSDRAKSRSHPPTTSGRVCYTDGEHNKLLKEEDMPYYESLGWKRGKTIKNNIPAWNKGLTKETDDRVKKYSDKRRDAFNRGESIGCFGIKGNSNGFVKGCVPWNKGLKGYNSGHPNYYRGKSKD